MKRNLLAIILGIILVVSLVALVACDGQESALDAARDYIYQSYKNSDSTTKTATPKDKSLMVTVKIGDETFPITWSLKETNLKNVSIEQADGKATIKIANTMSTTREDYTLIATITDGKDTRVIEFEYYYPAFQPVGWETWKTACDNSSKDAVTIKARILGVISTGSSLGSFYAQDDQGYGYYVYNPAWEEEISNLKDTEKYNKIVELYPVGTEVYVTGTGTLYNGQYEFNKGSSVVKTGAEASTNFVIKNGTADWGDAAGNDDAGLAAYQNTLVTLNNCVLTTVDGSYYYFVIGSKGNQFNIYYNTYFMSESEANTWKNAFKAGQACTITGLVSVYSNKFQIYPIFVDNTISEVRAPDFLSNAEMLELARKITTIDETIYAAPGTVTKELPTTTPLSTAISIRWEFVDADQTVATLDGNKITYTATADAQTVAVRAIFSMEGAEDVRRVYDVTIAPPISVTVEDFLAAEVSDIAYALTGWVVADNSASKASSFVLADATGAVFSYNNADVAMGDYVRVIGTRYEYQGVIQLATISAEVIEAPAGATSPYNKEEAIEINVAELDYSKLTSGTIGEYMGKLYKLTGSILRKSGSYVNAYIRVAGDDGEMKDKQVIQLYPGVCDTTNFIDKEVVIYGYVRGFSTDSYITIQAAEIELAPIAEKTDAEAVAFEKENLSIKTNVTADTEIALPAAGSVYSDQVAITWAIKDGDAITGGKLAIALEAEEREIVVVATLTAGDATDTKEFTIKVAAKPTEAAPGSDKDHPMTPEQARAEAAKLTDRNPSTEWYYVLGTIVDDPTADYCNFHFISTDPKVDGLLVYGLWTADGTKKYGSNGKIAELPVKKGDTVLLYAHVQNYDGKMELNNACLITVNGESVVPSHTCAHVCATCGKCTDATCTDAACADKCQGHEEVVVTIAEFLAKEVDATAEYVIYGWIVADNAASGAGSFVVADATGAVFSYNKADVAMGDYVKVVATRSVNYGVPQLGTKSATVVEAPAGAQNPYDNTAAIVLDTTTLDLSTLSADTIEVYTGKLYKFTGATLKKDSYVNAYVGDTQVIQLFSGVIDTTDMLDQEVVIYGYVRGFKANSYITVQASEIVLAVAEQTHVCAHVCATCGKCTDATCTDAACADKCQGHQPAATVEDIAFGENGIIWDGSTGIATTTPDAWYYWAAKPEFNQAASVEVSQVQIVNGVVTVAYTSTGTMGYGVQLFYHYSTSVVGTTYKLTLKVMSTIDNTIQINKQNVALEANVEKEVEITFVQPSVASYEGASISIQIPVDNNGATITLWDVAMEEAPVVPVDPVDPVDSLELPKDATFEKGAESNADNKLCYWYVEDAGWNCGAVVDLKAHTYENGVITLTYVGGSANFCTQLFYRSSALKNGETYTLTLNINASTAGTCIVNSKEIALVEGDNAVTVEYVVGANGISDLDIQFNASETEVTYVVSNVAWNIVGTQGGDTPSDEPVALTLAFVDTYNGTYMHFTCDNMPAFDFVKVNGTQSWSEYTNNHDFKVNVGTLNGSADYTFEFVKDGKVVATASYSYVAEAVVVPEIALTFVAVLDEYNMSFTCENVPAYDFIKVNGTQYGSKYENNTLNVYVGKIEGSADYTFEFVKDGKVVANASYSYVAAAPVEPEKEEVVVYTLTFLANNSNNAYANNYDVTVDDVDWSVPGNQFEDHASRIGGKNLTEIDRVIYGKTAIDQSITKIVVKMGPDSGTAITVNSMKIEVYATAEDCANGTNAISTVSGDYKAESDITFEKPADADWTNCYYRIVFNVTVAGNSNKFVKFVQADFYAEK